MLLYPSLKLGLDLSQVDEYVLTCLNDWCRVASCALGLDKFNSVDKLAAAVTLVTLSVSKATSFVGATAADHSVSERGGARFAVLLVDSVLVSVTLFKKVLEDILGDLSLLRRGSSSELIEITIEPLVDLSMQGMVVVADLLGSLAFLAGLGFGGRTILIGSTDV